MERQRQSQPLPFASAGRQKEKTTSKLVQPLAKLFRDRGPVRPQDLIRQKLRGSLDLPHSASSNMTPRPLQPISPMQSHPYSSFFPSGAPFAHNVPVFPSPVHDAPQHQPVRHDQNNLRQVPSRFDATALRRVQTAEPRPQSPLSAKIKGGVGMRWAKKALSPFSRAKERQQATLPDVSLHTTPPDAFVRQRFHDDSLSALEKPVVPLKREQALPHFGLRRKPLPRSTSLDSQLPDVLFTSSEGIGKSDDANVGNRFDPGRDAAGAQDRTMASGIAPSGRGRTTMADRNAATAQARHPYALQRRLSAEESSSLFYPDPPQQPSIPVDVRMQAPTVPSQAPLQTSAGFTSQPMSRTIECMQPLYLNRPRQPPELTLPAAPRPPEADLDGQDGASMDWHYAHLSAIGRFDEIIATASSAQPRQDVGLSIRLEAEQDPDTSSEQALQLQRKNIIVPQRRSSSEVPRATRANPALRFPVSTNSSAVNAFELEQRLRDLEAAERQQRNAQSARKASPSQRRGFAEKMLSGGAPFASERPANDMVAEMQTSALGLKFPKQGDVDVMHARNPNATDKDLEARVGQRVLYRNRTPMPGRPHQGAPVKLTSAPYGPPIPQLGNGTWTETDPASHRNLDFEAHGHSKAQGVGNHSDGVALAPAEGQLSKDSSDSRSMSLTPSQVELLDRMEVWREKVAHTPNKQMYAPSASASFRADGKPQDGGQQDADMTSVSRRVQVGGSLAAAPEGGATKGNVVVESLQRVPVEPRSSFSASHNRSHVDHSQHISFQGPASELVKFVRGSMDIPNSKDARQEKLQQSTWRKAPEELLIDIDDGQGVASRKTPSPPVVYDTRTVGQTSEKDSQHLLDMMDDHLGDPHTPKSRKDDSPVAECGQLTADEMLMWSVLNDSNGDGQAGVDLLLEAYRKELRDFLRMNPRMLLLVKLRNKMGKHDGAIGERSSSTGSTQRMPSSSRPDGQGQEDAGLTQPRHDDRHLGRTAQSISANVETIGELSQVQRSLIELHRELLACVSDNVKRDALMQRLTSLEKAVFVPM